MKENLVAQIIDMRRPVVRGAIGAAILGGVMYGVPSVFLSDSEEFNDHVSACSEALEHVSGSANIGVDVAVVPEACGDTSAFPSTVESTTRRLSNGETSSVRSVTYHLPSANRYNVVAEQSYQDAANVLERGRMPLGVVGGIFGFIAASSDRAGLARTKKAATIS